MRLAYALFLTSIGFVSLVASGCGDAVFGTATAGDASAPDDAFAGQDGGTLDSAPDAPIVVADGGGDAGFCGLAKHVLCDDFDEHGPLWPLPIWDGGIQPAAAFSFISRESISVPLALLVEAPNDGGTKPMVAGALPDTLRLHCEAYVRADTIGAAEAPVATITGVYAGSAFQIHIVAIPSSIAWGINLGATSTPVRSLAAGVWTHVSIDLAPGVAVTDLLGTISFDGMANQNIVIPGATRTLTTGLRVQLETSSDPAWSVAFDNVFCDEP